MARVFEYAPSPAGRGNRRRSGMRNAWSHSLHRYLRLPLKNISSRSIPDGCLILKRFDLHRGHIGWD
jgi:hypothetical protein